MCEQLLSGTKKEEGGEAEAEEEAEEEEAPRPRQGAEGSVAQCRLEELQAARDSLTWDPTTNTTTIIVIGHHRRGSLGLCTSETHGRGRGGSTTSRHWIGSNNMDPWASPWADDTPGDPPIVQPHPLPPPAHSSPPSPPPPANQDFTRYEVDPWAAADSTVHNSTWDAGQGDKTQQSTDQAGWATRQTEEQHSASWREDIGVGQTESQSISQRHGADGLDESISQPKKDTTLTASSADEGWAPEQLPATSWSQPAIDQEQTIAEPSGLAGQEMWEDSAPRIVTPSASMSKAEDEDRPKQTTAEQADVQQPPRPSMPSIPAQKTTLPSQAKESSNQTSVNASVPDSGEGWQMEKPTGASALAGKVGGWISGAVARRKADIGPPVVSAEDHDASDEEPSEAPTNILDVDSLTEAPAQPKSDQQSNSQAANTGFWGRWRKQPANSEQSKQQQQSEAQTKSSSSAIDNDSLDWLSAQTAAPASSRPQQQPSQSSSSLFFGLGRRGQQPAREQPTGATLDSNSNVLDFDIFENAAGPSSTSKRTPQKESSLTQSTRNRAQTAQRPTAPNLFQDESTEDTLAMFDTLSIQHSRRQPQTGPHAGQMPRSMQQQPPRPATLRPADFVDGRADEDDLEAVGFDYRDDEADDEAPTGTSASQWPHEPFSDKPMPPAPFHPSPSNASQAGAGTNPTRYDRSQPSKSTASLDEPRRSFSPNSLGQIHLNRTSSTTAGVGGTSPLVRASSNGSTWSGRNPGGAANRTSLLPPPPSSRQRTTIGPAPTSINPPPLHNHSQTQLSRPPQHALNTQTQRQALSQGQGMTSDDLAFFEGL